jgi:hypothetical protein
MTILRFGCWRGHCIKTVPIEYVLWLLGQRWFRADHVESLYPLARARAMRHFSAELEAQRSWVAQARQDAYESGFDLV